MAGPGKDAIVQQLLEERRRRLQQKLYGDAGGGGADVALDGSFVSADTGPGAAYIGRSALPSSEAPHLDDADHLSYGGLHYGDDGGDTDLWAQEFLSHEPFYHQDQEPDEITEPAEFTFAGGGRAYSGGASSSRYGHGGDTSYEAASADGVQATLDYGSDAGSRSTAARNSGGASSGGARQQHQFRPRPRSAPPARAPRSQRERALSAPKQPPPTPNNRRGDFHSRVQEWQLRHQAFQNKKKDARREKESQEMQECTFKPSINARSEFYARRSRGCYLEPLAQRLHHEADKRNMLRQKAKELMQADEMCSYTFRPEINRRRPSSSSAVEQGRTPIHLRTEELLQQKAAATKATQAAEDARIRCSFQPRISERSERLVQKKRDDMYKSVSQGDPSCLKMLGPVEDRLYAEAQAREQRRAAPMDSVTDGSVSAPSVDEESRRICKASVYFQGAQQDFLTRQQTFELAKQRRMEVRSQRADAKCPFKPEISDTSRQIVDCNIDFVGETSEERVNRLAVRDAERREQMRGALEQIHYQDCTFRPSVNYNSQLIVSRLEDQTASLGLDSAEPVYDRLYRSSNYRERPREDPVGQECTFKPQVERNGRYAHVKAHYSANIGGSKIMDNVRDELEKKEEYLAQRRLELEESERFECTFAPDTRRPYEEPSRPVAVSGLGRFFELKGLAQRKQREQEERQTKAFNPEASGSRCGGVTITEPFNLSGGGNGSRVWKEQGQDPEECTFVPRTIESEKRALIQQLVGSSNPLPFR